MIFNVDFKESTQVINAGVVVESGVLTQAAVDEHNKDQNAHAGLLKDYAKTEAVTEAIAGVKTETAETIDEVKTDAAENTAKAIAETEKKAQDLYANAIKGSASGEVVRVDDVSPVEHRARVKVGSKNLFDYTKIALIDNYQKFKIAVEPGKTYTASSNIPKGEAAEIYFNGDFTTDNGVWEGQPRTFKATSDEMYIAFQKRVNLEGIVNGTYYVQVEEGDTATDYEPYIDPATVKVTRCGKNVYKLTAKSQTANGITYTVNSDGSVTVNGTATKTYFMGLGGFYQKADATYHLSGSPVGSDFDTYMLYIHNNTTGADIYDLGNGKTFKGTEGDQGLVIAVYEGATLNNLTFYPMVVLGEQGGDYEPHTSETYTPDANGIVEINTLAPTMTLLTDKAGASVEVEYNKDTNAVIGKIEPVHDTNNTAIIELSNNTAYYRSELTELALTLPTVNIGYISELVFSSGATATALTYPDTIYITGDDCAEGVFVPKANYRYDIILWYDGASVQGVVRGVPYVTQ